MLNMEAATNQACCGIVPNEGLNPNYLYQYLAYKNSYLVSLSAGSGQQNISKSILEKFKIPIPSIYEQRKIATVLYIVDQAIQKTDKIIKQTGRTQRGIEQRLFQEGYFDHPDVKEQRLVTIPSDWKFEQLSKHTKDSAFGPRFSSDRYGKDGSIATLRTTDLNDRGHITYETMPVANLEQSEIEDHLLEPADFMITRSGTTGIGTVWGEYDKPTVPGAFLIRFRFEESISSQFMKYYVNSSIGRKRINRRAKGGVQKNLAGSDLLNMRFPIPSMDEQEKIVEVLDTTERRIKSEHKFKSRLQRFKQGLMQDLLSGAVRTHDTDIDIPEAVLANG